MRTIKVLLACAIMILSCFTGYSRDIDTKLNAETLYVAEVKPWNQRTMREKYGNITWNNASYNVGAGKIDEALIDKKLGSGTAMGIDEINNFKKHSTKCDIYSVKSVSTECVLAVKYQRYKGYYPFSNHFYVPETLGSLIADLNLKENLVINNKIYYSYWKGGVVASGNYVSMVYSLPDPSVVWDLLLSDTSIKNSGDKHYLNSLMSVSVDMKITGEKNISLAVNEDGYLQTNILGTAKSFYIGKKKVNEFVKYVKTHGTGSVIVPDPNAKDIPE